MTTDIQTEADKIFEIKKVGTLMSNSLGIAIIIAAILALAYLVWGAIDWITSTGDQEKLKSAKNKITHAVIGLAIMAAVWLVWRLAIYFLVIGVIKQGQVDFDLKNMY